MCKRFMGSKVHRFGLVPLTIIPTDRFEKVLKILKLLRFAICDAKPLSSSVTSIPLLQGNAFPASLKDRLEKLLKVLKILRFFEYADSEKQQQIRRIFRYPNTIPFPLGMPLLVTHPQRGN